MQSCSTATRSARLRPREFRPKKDFQLGVVRILFGAGRRDPIGARGAFSVCPFLTIVAGTTALSSPLGLSGGARCPSAAWAERRRTARRPGRTPGRRPEPSRAPPTRRAAIHAPPRDFTSIREAAAEAAAAGVTTTPQSTAHAAGAGSTRRVCWTRNMCAASPPTLPALRRNDNFSRTPCAVAVQI